MRTTISIEDAVLEAAKSRAQEAGQTLGDWVTDAVRARLAHDERGAVDVPFHLITFGEGGVFPGIDLDRTSELLVADDVATYGRR